MTIRSPEAKAHAYAYSRRPEVLERKRARMAKWRVKNKKEIRAKNLAYYQANKVDLRLVSANYAARHRDDCRLKSSRYRARLASQVRGEVTVRDLKRMLRHYRNECAYCSVKLTKVHWDHVIPLARGGTHAIGNLVPTCPSCNTSKGKRLLSEWRYRGWTTWGLSTP